MFTFNFNSIFTPSELIISSISEAPETRHVCEKEEPKDTHGHQDARRENAGRSVQEFDRPIGGLHPIAEWPGECGARMARSEWPRPHRHRQTGTATAPKQTDHCSGQLRNTVQWIGDCADCGWLGVFRWHCAWHGDQHWWRGGKLLAADSLFSLLYGELFVGSCGVAICEYVARFRWGGFESQLGKLKSSFCREVSGFLDPAIEYNVG